jgi:hypothetical protein
MDWHHLDQDTAKDVAEAYRENLNIQINISIKHAYTGLMKSEGLHFV